MKNFITGIIIFVVFVAGCSRERVPKQIPAEPRYDISDLTSEANAWADSVCAVLDVKSKAAQLFMPAVFASADYWTVRQVKDYADIGIGGLVLLKGDTVGARTLVDSIREFSGVNPFVAIDAEWGLAMRLADTPKFPANHNISESADDQLMYDYGREVAREARQLGINMILGPVLDVSGPDSFMLRRSFGNDPGRVADLAVSYARGLEDGDVISVAKHFPGHGSVTSDSHKTKGVIERSLNEMDSVDLYPFRKWIEQHLSAIMVGHLAVPSVDSQMLPAAVSPTVITDLLRNDLGFSGLIITDAINMKGAEGYGGLDAIKAGADIVIAPGDTYKEINRVVEAVENGLLSEDELDTHVRKVLFYKYLVGLDKKNGIVSTEPIRSANADSIASRLRP